MMTVTVCSSEIDAFLDSLDTSTSNRRSDMIQHY